MVTILLDSSSLNLVIGLCENDVLVDSLCYEAWQRQSELMIQELDAMLNKHHYTKDDIKAVATTIGPGSYTGVRIAVTIAKIMSISLNIPIYTFSSLHILKDKDNYSICVSNARSNRSYVGVYQGINKVLEDQIMTNEDLFEYIKNHQDYSICGDISYLQIEGVKSDVFQNMIELLHFKKHQIDPLGVKPIYLKG